MNIPSVLECTLRDGSYVVDFQFTARDTAVIGAALEIAGFRFIEVGHGLGMNASQKGGGVAAATDEAYLRAAAEALQVAEWGMFFIPGIGRMEDLEMAAEHGMDFVRIGTNAAEVRRAEPFIEHARRLGMHVSANLMKSYTLPPDELAEQAALAESYGADLVCVVDSAGCLLPRQVGEYVCVMRDRVSLAIGFHGHDNLSLAVANTVAAIEAGADRVDSTLQGMGRGGGNATTEVLIPVLMRMGLAGDIDINRLMDISGRLIRPLLPAKGWDPINITSGYAGFHSSFLTTILKYADLYAVDARDLIVGVCEVDQVSASEELVESVAASLLHRQRSDGLQTVPLARTSFPTTEPLPPENSLPAAVQQVVRTLRTVAKKRGWTSVLNIVAAQEPSNRASISRFVQEELGFAIGSVELDNVDQLTEVVSAADGVVDLLMVDMEPKDYLPRPLYDHCRETAEISEVLGYKDSDVWVHSVGMHISVLHERAHRARVVLAGVGPLAVKLILSLVEQGTGVTVCGASAEKLKELADLVERASINGNGPNVIPDAGEAAREADLLVGFDRGGGLITPAVIRALPPEAIVFDAAIGAVTPEAITEAHRLGVRIVRPDMRVALAAEIAARSRTARSTQTNMGRREICGIPVVAGGIIGHYGDVVVDSVGEPSQVVGVADGCGAVIYGSPPEFVESLAIVEREIVRRQVSA